MKVSIKTLVLLFLLGVGIILITVGYLFPQLTIFVQKLLYWLLLLFVIDLTVILKLQGKTVLNAAFLITVIGALLNIVSFWEIGNFSEIVLRFAFIFWIVGIGQVMLSPTQKL